MASVHCGHDCRYGTDEGAFTVENALNFLLSISSPQSQIYCLSYKEIDRIICKIQQSFKKPSHKFFRLKITFNGNMKTYDLINNLSCI